METRETLVRQIEKLADFQMRKSTHIRFLENCATESVVPKGLNLELKVQVGENSRLQKIVDGILRKTSMEITRIVSEEHYLQLQESKSKMTELENKLRKVTSNEGEFNTITHNIFTKTESKKNKIVDKQNKKLSKLTDSRDCYIDHVSPADSATSQPQESNDNLKNKVANRSTHTACKSGQKKPKQKRPKQARSKAQSKLTEETQQVDTELSTTCESKNEVAPISAKKSYSTAVKMGQPRHTKCGEEPIQHPTANQKQLNNAIMQLVNCLKTLNGIGDSSASQTENNGGNKRRFKKKFRGGKRQS